MRLFTGISLPESTRYQLEAFLAPLRPLANIRWAPAQNLHITTKFIGAWPEDKLQDLKEALQTVSQCSFEIALGGLGWFPNPHTPHVFWMGVHGGPALTELAEASENIAASIGIAKEERSYTPHLTLARTRREANLRALRQALERMDPPAFPAFPVTQFHLYQSDSGIYRKLESFDFAGLRTGPNR